MVGGVGGRAPHSVSVLYSVDGVAVVSLTAHVDVHLIITVSFREKGKERKGVMLTPDKHTNPSVS